MSIAATTDKSFLDLDVRYVSPRATKSIVAQCGRIKPTTETLQSVNAFLDELVTRCAQLLYDQWKLGASFPIDVEQAKSVLGELIEPGPFYNELLSAAAVAVRHQLRTPKSPGPQSTFGGLTPSTITSAESLAQLLRARCLYYSTLGGDASSFQPAWESDIIDMQSAVFFATALEFIGMHALREGARVAIHKERPLVRMQDTYNVLAADPSVGPVFQKTTVYRNLKVHVTPEPVSTLDTPRYGEPRTPVSPNQSVSDDASKRPSSMIKSASSDRSDSDRIQSPTGGNQATNQSEGDGNEVWRVMGPNSPTRASDQALEFEDLLKGKDTIKVSLTPNRLNNIEVAKNVAPIRPRGAQKNNVSMLTGRRASIVPPLRGGNLLIPPITVGDDDNSDLSADEDADEQGSPRKRGETLYEFLNSTGPEDLLSNGSDNNRASAKKQVSHSAGLGSVREEGSSTATVGRPNGARFNTISGTNSDRFTSHTTNNYGNNSENNNDDDDDDDDDLLPPGQKARAKSKEESLADFLRNTGPPEPTNITPPTPTPAPSKRPSRGMMRLFSRFNSNSSTSSTNSNVADDMNRSSSMNGSLNSNVSASSTLDSPSGSRRHIAIKIPYSPPIPEPSTTRSPIQAPPPPPKPVCEERGTQASKPVIVTEEKSTSTPVCITAEFAVQTDEIIEPEPEPAVVVETAEIAIQTDPEIVEPVAEPVQPPPVSVEPSEPVKEEKVPKVILPPEQVPLPELTEDEHIDLLETEEERETARRELESREETIRIPSAVLDLIRESLPTLIESGDITTCMEFLEELLTSGKSVHLKHSEAQTNLNGDNWLFQSTTTTTTTATSSDKLIKEVTIQGTVTTNSTCVAESLLTTTQSIVPLERRRSIG